MLAKKFNLKSKNWSFSLTFDYLILQDTIEWCRCLIGGGRSYEDFAANRNFFFYTKSDFEAAKLLFFHISPHLRQHCHVWFGLDC